MRNYIIAILSIAAFYGCGFSIETIGNEPKEKSNSEVLKTALENFCGHPKTARAPFVPDNDPCGPDSIVYFWFHESADTIPQITRNIRLHAQQLNDSLITQYIEVDIDTVDFIVHHRIGSYGRIDEAGNATGYNSFSFVGDRTCQANGYVWQGDSLNQIRTDEPGGRTSISMNIQKIDAQYLKDINWPWFIVTHECGHGVGCRCHGQDDFPEYFNDNCVLPSVCNGYKLDTLERSGMTYNYLDSCVTFDHYANSFYPDPTAFDWRINFEQNGRRNVVPEFQLPLFQKNTLSFIEACFSESQSKLYYRRSKDIDTILTGIFIDLLTDEGKITTEEGLSFLTVEPSLYKEDVEAYFKHYNSTGSFAKAIELMDDVNVRNALSTKLARFAVDTTMTEPPDTIIAPVDTTLVVHDQICEDCSALNYGEVGECVLPKCRAAFSTDKLPKSLVYLYSALANGEDVEITYLVDSHRGHPVNLETLPRMYLSEFGLSIEYLENLIECNYPETDVTFKRVYESKHRLRLSFSNDPNNTSTGVASAGGVNGSCEPYPSSINIPINNKWKYQGTISRTKYELSLIIEHEIGHALLGLHHCQHSSFCECRNNTAWIMQSPALHYFTLSGFDQIFTDGLKRNVERFKNGQIQDCSEMGQKFIECKLIP